MGLSCEIVGVIIGGIIGIGSGLLVTWYSKYLEVKRTKKYISRALCAEVEANQGMLKGMSDRIPHLGYIPEGKNGEDKNALEFLRGIRFERTVYSGLSKEIGILDIGNLEGLAKYYGGLKMLEAMFLLIPQLVSIKDEQKRRDQKEKIQAAIGKVYLSGEGVLKELKRCAEF